MEFPLLQPRRSISGETWEKFSSRFVFITGNPRSGTTILQRILLEHPSIWGLFEESRLFMCGWSDNRIYDRLHQWDAEAVQKNRQIVLEKSPYQISCWSRIFTLLPDAKIIFCLRDGREVAASVADMFQQSPEQTVKRWLYGVKQYEAAKRAFPDQVHLLLLQDLQTEPEQTIGDVLQFLGIESSPAILSLLLSYHERPRSLQTPYNIDMTEAGKEAPPKSTPDMGYQRWQANLPLQVMSRNWTETFSETDYPQLHEQMRDTLIQYGFIR